MNKFWLKKQYLMHNPKKKGRLPSGFQEVEYIQSIDASVGLTYFETDIMYNSNNQYVFELEMNTLSTTQYNATFGWDAGGQINISKTEIHNGQSGAYIDTLEKTKIIETIEAGTSTNTIITATNSSGTKTITRTHQSLYDYALSNGYGIFTRFSKGNISDPRVARLYSFKCSINGVLTNELVPCYRKSDNEVGLYDIVGKQFYTNSGSGKFLMGRPLVYDTIQGYQQVDYIESTGRQYIALNTPITSNYNIEIDYERTGTINFLLGTSKQGAFHFCLGGDFIIRSTGWYAYNYTTTGNREVIRNEGKYWYLNDSLATTTPDVPSITMEYGLTLFVYNVNGAINSSTFSSYKLFNFKEYYGNELKANYIPMRRKSDGELGMYDLVTNTFFTNQGSGTFLKGADV